MREATRDTRTRGVRALILNGEIAKFEEIFFQQAFPYTLLARYLGTNNGRIRRMIDNPGEITLFDVKRMADYFEVDYDAMNQIIKKQFFSKKMTWPSKIRPRKTDLIAKYETQSNVSLRGKYKKKPG